MEGGPGSTPGHTPGPAADLSMRTMMDRQSLIQRSHNHVAHDLLSLKYGDESGQLHSARYQIPTPEIKHEVGGAPPPSVSGLRFDPTQMPQWHIKVERPDLAQMMGLQRAVTNMAAANRMSVQSPPGTPRDQANGGSHHGMHGVPTPGYGFQHHNL